MVTRDAFDFAAFPRSELLGEALRFEGVHHVEERRCIARDADERRRFVPGTGFFIFMFITHVVLDRRAVRESSPAGRFFP